MVDAEDLVQDLGPLEALSLFGDLGISPSENKVTVGAWEGDPMAAGDSTTTVGVIDGLQGW